MSKIEGLTIQGIRSFPPGHREIITFNTPLTLIVGYNGSGKTTIIECLKYATTGELPPNSKGGAFIHDPKLCGEKEVLGQVKLRFQNGGGDKFTVTRSLSLTMQRNKRTQKTLDASFVFSNGGERNVLSTRVAEMDELVPRYLGVSSAILDAVIFCHQDESLWPMSEPAALKKKFDEIFEAMRYTKAIDNLKVLRKKKGEDLRLLKVHEEQNRVNKEKGERNQKRCEALANEIEDIRAKAAQMTEKMDKTQQIIKQTREEANKALGVVQELRNKKDQYEFRQDAVVELRDTIEEMFESDEWLEATLAQYKDRLQRMQGEIDQNTAQYHELQNGIVSSRKNLSARLGEKGKLESDKEKYEYQVQTRIKKIHEAAGRHEIRGYDGDLSDNHVKSFMDKIQKILNDKRRDLERLQKENAKEQEKANAKITELETRKASRTQDRVSAKQRIGAIDKKVNFLQNDVAGLNFDEGKMAILEENQKDLHEKHQKLQQGFTDARWDLKIQEEADRLQSSENEAERLGRELVECTRLASARAQLDFRKKELEERKRKLATLISTWKDKLTAMIGAEWQPETVDSDFQLVLKQQKAAVDEARRVVERTQQELKKLEYKISSAKERQKTRSDDSERSSKAVLRVLRTVKDDAAIEDFTEELERLEDERLGLEKDLSLFEALKSHYTKTKKYLDKHNKCSLCDRHFDGSDQSTYKSKLIQKIAAHLSDEGKEDISRDLQKVENNLEQMRTVRPSYDSYERAGDELPLIEKELSAAEADKASIVRRLEEQDAKLKEVDERRRDVESMDKTVSSISQCFRDITDSEKQIERQASQQQSSTGLVRSADEVNERLATVTEQTRALKAKVATFTTDKQRMRDQLNELELDRSELKNKLSHTHRQMERKKDLEKQIQSEKEDRSQAEAIVRQADEDLLALDPEIAKARSIRDNALQRARAKEKVIADERDGVSNTVNELRMIENDIQNYLDQGGAEKLASVQRSLQALEQTIAQTDKEVTALTVQINKQKQELANSDRKKKNISDNLNYRKNLHILDKLKEEIDQLKEHKSQEEYDGLADQIRQQEDYHNRLVAERGLLWGSMHTKDEELRVLVEEWELDYKNSVNKYKESHISVETTKAAIEDLAKYGDALDKAIMQYHSLKMEEVNRIAGELWQATYQGTDIDTIMIRSENENATAKRSYNYRVCMTKQDTDMDMRGRCSAGQKVLASIIIRLALAESFGINCGLIALDEPTTNLDSDNIRSLAVSLHSIIKARQAQSNFQLIVITHDEEFLRHMQCSDFCDTFYRVKRDERQNSVIDKQSITRVME